MNSKHKIIQWNRILKRIGKAAPRLLPEMSLLSLTAMTAMTVYENDMRDFREKKRSVIILFIGHSNYSFAGLALLAGSIKLLMRYH